MTTPSDEKHEKAIKAFEGAAWFKDKFGFLKKGPKPPVRLPQGELFNLDSTASVETIHDRHQKNATTKQSEINLTHETDEDSASSSSSSSSDGSESSNDGSHSKTSSSDGEDTDATGGG